MNRGNVPGGLLGGPPGGPGPHIVGMPMMGMGNTMPGHDTTMQMPTNIVQQRDFLYRLIISQLFYDGYQQVAVTLSNIVHADPPCPPSDRLINIVALGMDKESEGSHRQLNKTEQLLGAGLDLEYETEMSGRVGSMMFRNKNCLLSYSCTLWEAFVHYRLHKMMMKGFGMLNWIEKTVIHALVQIQPS